jgi:hypothetical protein
MTVGVIVFNELSRLLCCDRVLDLVISRPGQGRVDSGVLGGLPYRASRHFTLDRSQENLRSKLSPIVNYNSKNIRQKYPVPYCIQTASYRNASYLLDSGGA